MKIGLYSSQLFINKRFKYNERVNVHWLDNWSQNLQNMGPKIQDYMAETRESIFEVYKTALD